MIFTYHLFSTAKDAKNSMKSIQQCAYFKTKLFIEKHSQGLAKKLFAGEKLEIFGNYWEHFFKFGACNISLSIFKLMSRYIPSIPGHFSNKLWHTFSILRKRQEICYFLHMSFALHKFRPKFSLTETLRQDNCLY